MAKSIYLRRKNVVSFFLSRINRFLRVLCRILAKSIYLRRKNVVSFFCLVSIDFWGYFVGVAFAVFGWAVWAVEVAGAPVPAMGGAGAGF